MMATGANGLGEWDNGGFVGRVLALADLVGGKSDLVGGKSGVLCGAGCGE